MLLVLGLAPLHQEVRVLGVLLGEEAPGPLHCSGLRLLLARVRGGTRNVSAVASTIAAVVVEVT
eukprot:965673-Pyramimonas_sp.AAC.1